MLQMKMAIQRLSPGRVLLLSAVAALFTIASLAWPASPMNRYEAEQFAQKHFPGAVINTLELRPLGGVARVALAVHLAAPVERQPADRGHENPRVGSPDSLAGGGSTSACTSICQTLE